jgi:hypothetical protein
MTDQSSKQRRRTLICAILAIATTHDQWTRSWAQDVKNVHAGYELASKVCSPCHVVAPLPAPSFMDIAKSQYGSLAPLESLLRSTHSDVSHPGGMPNISLSENKLGRFLPTSVACAKHASFAFTSTAGATFQLCRERVSLNHCSSASMSEGGGVKTNGPGGARQQFRAAPGAEPGMDIS